MARIACGWLTFVQASLILFTASGQSVNAILTGLVTDPSNAPIAAAKVTAENTKTGVATETATNDSGNFIFPSLQPGLYTLKAQASGFRVFVAHSVNLEVGSRVRVDAPLEVGSVAESIEVQAMAESPLETIGSSVGAVVTQRRVLDLPLAGRDASTLVALQAGVVGDNFSGLRIASQNVQLDGVNIQDARFQGGAIGGNLVIFPSVDRIAEFRVVTSPADAEFGRGSAQVQLITRSGTNELHGSVFLFNRVHALAANTWFNNQRGLNPDGTPVTPRNFLVRNQYGARIGGPIVKNRTFFHFLWEGQRQTTKNSVTNTTLTEQARRGIFRYFPGVQNGNANSSNPAVDLNGSPVRPAGATGDLRSENLFAVDPNRPRLDPTGNVQKIVGALPLPNNFRSGDGLNTAGYTWQRRETNDLDSYSLRLDHALTDRQRMSFTYLQESQELFNGFSPQIFPTFSGGDFTNGGKFYSYSLASTIAPSVLNEFRAGAQRVRLSFRAPWDVGGIDILPKIGNQPFYFFSLLYTDPYNVNSSPQGRISPVYQIADSLSWLRGKHAFKGGFDFRFASTNGYNSFRVIPRAVSGAGAAPVQGVSALPGIAGNTATAQNLLIDLSGSLTSFEQQVNSPGGPNAQFLPGEFNQRTWRQREYSFFFKDDWKLTTDVTLNVGMRWEYYGVPFEANGKSVIPAGGSAAVFGTSGRDFSALYRPGLAEGSLVQQELVGRTTANPDKGIYDADYNNFAPAVGFSWSLPWFGKGRTVFRAGYGIAYDRNLLRNVDIYAGDVPGLNRTEVYRSGSYLDLTRVPTPVPITAQPLSIIPLTDRSGTLRAYDTGLRTPYNQNFNVSLQRELTNSTVFTARYVGSKGTKLLRGTNVNEVNIFENGILDAFRITQAGENAPLFDRIFDGFTVPSRGVVNGTTVRGSEYVRSNASMALQLATNQAGAFANTLNTSTLAGTPGQLLRRAGLAENSIVVSPQFLNSLLLSNFANSTYHSLQLEVEKRFARGWTFQGNYTWSKALGEEEGAAQQLEDTYRSGRDRGLDKRLLAFHRTHNIKLNGIWELPFGRGKRFGSDRNGALDRIVGGWKTGGILTWNSGAPLNVISNIATFNQISADNTPVVTVSFPKSVGAVTRDARGATYFEDLRQIGDPGRLNLAPGLQSLSTLRAITDASGAVLLANPAAGQLGNLAPFYLSGPSAFSLDLSVIKAVRFTERYNAEIRADLIDATNTPRFGAPDLNINSLTFGRITSASGNRTVVLGARFNF